MILLLELILYPLYLGAAILGAPVVALWKWLARKFSRHRVIDLSETRRRR